MRRHSHRLKVRDAFRAHYETYGCAPTYRELGKKVGISAVAAWKNVQALIHDGILAKRGSRVVLADHGIDLGKVPTDELRGELARRGVTLDALEEPQPLRNEGRACAANHCLNRVKRGQLMCREHWFQLPGRLRTAIMAAWSARHVQAFQEAVEAARDHLGGFTRVVERAE